MDEQGQEVDFAVRQFFRPTVLMFVALAVAFAGWSYGYKLSQYLHHPEINRASLTRAWVDQRNDSVSVQASHQVDPVESADLDLFAPSALNVARRSPDLVLESPTPVREAFLFSALIPFRAPPSHRSSLA